jgi:hypothetical protein
MLFVSLLLLVVGFALVYAGVKNGNTGLWQKPWQPFAEQLGAKKATAS